MSAASHRPAARGNLKKGICQNHNYTNPDTGETGDCPKCASGEVQTVNVQRLSDFKCSECGSKLTPVKEKGKGKLIAIIAAAIVAVGAAVAFLIPKGGDKEPTSEPGAETPVALQDTLKQDTSVEVDTIAQPADTIASETVEETVVSPKEEPKPEPKAKAEPQSANKSVLGGAAVLINEGGYKTLKFKRGYDLDLGKSDGAALHISAGDEIYNAHIVHNVLRGGQYKNSAGTERGLSGLNVKL